MTTYRYTITLDESEHIMLNAALAMLRDECDVQIAKKSGAPYWSYLRSIERVQKKLANSWEQMSGHTFNAETGTQIIYRRES